MTSPADLRQRFKALIQGDKGTDGNVSENISDLVLFDDAVSYLARICRVLRTPGGQVLLIGDRGLGKRSLAHLASFIAGCRTFNLSLSRYMYVVSRHGSRDRSL